MSSYNAPRIFVSARGEFLRGIVRTCHRPGHRGAGDRRPRFACRIVRAYEAAKTTGVRLIVGCRLDLADGMSVSSIRPTGPPMRGFADCCRWARSVRQGAVSSRLVRSRRLRRGLDRGPCPDEADDICALLSPAGRGFPRPAYMALTLRRRPNDALRLYELSNMALQARVPTVVTNDVLFHVRRPRSSGL